MSSQSKSLGNEIDLALKKKRLENMADKESANANILASISAFVLLVGAILKSDANVKRGEIESTTNKLNTVSAKCTGRSETYFQQAATTAALRHGLQKEKRDAYADLAESVERLRNLKSDKDDLKTAIALLDVAIKSLGGV